MVSAVRSSAEPSARYLAAVTKSFRSAKDSACMRHTGTAVAFPKRMAKYESARRSHPSRASHEGQASLHHVPTVRRSALDVHEWQTVRPGAQQEPAQSADLWDELFGDLTDDEEALPVPEMGLEEETRIVARTAFVPPLAAAEQEMSLIDALAMLEAATIRSEQK